MITIIEKKKTTTTTNQQTNKRTNEKDRAPHFYFLKIISHKN